MSMLLHCDPYRYLDSHDSHKLLPCSFLNFHASNSKRVTRRLVLHSIFIARTSHDRALAIPKYRSAPHCKPDHHRRPIHRHRQRRLENRPKRSPSLFFSLFPRAHHLQLELRPNSIRLTLPFPLLSTGSLDAFVHPPQLQREPGTKLLQTGFDVFQSGNGLAICPKHGLLSSSFFTKSVPMSPYKDEIPESISK